MVKYCKSCGEEIHPLRVKALPNTQTCIKCSTTSMKKGIPVLNGNIDQFIEAGIINK